MGLPEPQPGLVISYSFLWSEEAEQGQVEGRSRSRWFRSRIRRQAIRLRPSRFRSGSKHTWVSTVSAPGSFWMSSTCSHGRDTTCDLSGKATVACTTVSCHHVCSIRSSRAPQGISEIITDKVCLAVSAAEQRRVHPSSEFRQPGKSGGSSGDRDDGSNPTPHGHHPCGRCRAGHGDPSIFRAATAPCGAAADRTGCPGENRMATAKKMETTFSRLTGNRSSFGRSAA